MEFIISDTCIFIDLIELEFIEKFFALPFEFYTTDFVVSEIKNPSQSSKIRTFIASGKLKVLSALPDDLLRIAEIAGQHPKLSISDCSVFYFGKKNNFKVLTNDKHLRQISLAIGVHGILWIFDCLLSTGIISKRLAGEKLKELIGINQRLPQDECLLRIKEWS